MRNFAASRSEARSSEFCLMIAKCLKFNFYKSEL